MCKNIKKIMYIKIKKICSLVNLKFGSKKVIIIF